MRKRTTSRWISEKRSLIAELADTAKRHAQPPIDERLKSILVSGIGSLLSGGYEFADIREKALELLREYDGIRGYSKLSQLHMRVRAMYAKRQQDEHRALKDEDARAYPRSKAMPTDWRNRCRHDGCRAIALYSLDFCAAHERDAA